MRLAALTTAAFIALAAAAHASPLGDADRADIDNVILADMDDAAFDAQFVCPETLPSADEREEALARYAAWSHLRHPDWSFGRRLEARTALLRRHGCTATLANVANSGQPAFPGWAYPPRK